MEMGDFCVATSVVTDDVTASLIKQAEIKLTTGAQSLDCSLHPVRCVLHLLQYILHPVYILYIPGVLRVWGLVGRHAVGGLLRVVRLFFRPARPSKRPQVAQTPIRLAFTRKSIALDQQQSKLICRQ